MMTTQAILVRSGMLALYLLCGACSEPSQSESTPSAQARHAPVKTESAPAKRAQSKTAPTAATQPGATTPAAMSSVAPPPIALPPAAARGTLLQRLPKSTLLALRLPHVEKLKTAFERTSIHALLDMPAFAAQRAQVDAGYARFAEELSQEIPDFEELKATVMALEGEAVLAILSVDALAFSPKSDDIECPVTAALMFDAGDHAAELDALLQRGFALIEKKAEQGEGRVHRAELVSSGTDAWHRRVRPDGVSFDIVREGSQFLLQIGPSQNARTEAPLASRTLSESFLAADVVRGTPDLEREGSLPVAEVFLNLDPVWPAVELLAPEEAKAILAGCGVTSLRGLSAVAGLGQTGIDEVLIVHSPTGSDLLSKVLTNRPLASKLARFVPPGASAAAIGAFDVAYLFESIVKLLPEEERRELDASLASQKKDGFDLRRDVIANIGPTFGFMGENDLVSLFSGGGAFAREIDFTLLVQLQDAARFRALIDRLLSKSGAQGHVQKVDIHGFQACVLEAIPVPGPDGKPKATIQPCWYVGDDMLLLSFSRLGLERALEAAWDEANRGPAAMKSALEEHGAKAFSITTTAPANGLSASTAVGLRTGRGLEVRTREGSGTASTYSVVGGLALASSIALPKLMSSRVAANERAAVATLRNIYSAEMQFHESALVDQDGDGKGEYGTLAEMCGTTPVRGGTAAIDPAVLPGKMKPDDNGLSQRSGYVFRVDLAEGKTGAADSDEHEFFVYAWPTAFGNTGTKVFVIDAEGLILSSDNRGDGQRYEGLSRAPKRLASRYAPPAREVRASATHRGRDGGTWRPIE